MLIVGYFTLMTTLSVKKMSDMASPLHVTPTVRKSKTRVVLIVGKVGLASCGLEEGIDNPFLHRGLLFKIIVSSTVVLAHA